MKKIVLALMIAGIATSASALSKDEKNCLLSGLITLNWLALTICADR